MKSLPYAIELYFDEYSTRPIEEIKKQFKTENILIDEGIKPHISLAIYKDLPIKRFRRQLELFSDSMQSFKLKFSSYGFFLHQSICDFSISCFESNAIEYSF